MFNPKAGNCFINAGYYWAYCVAHEQGQIKGISEDFREKLIGKEAGAIQRQIKSNLQSLENPSSCQM